MTGEFAQHYGVLEYLDAGVEVSPAEFSGREREVLETINRRVAAAETLAGVMDFVFDASLEITPCDRLGLAFVEEDGRRVVSRWTRATYVPLLLGEGYAEDMAGSSLAALLEGNRVRVINDLAAYLRERPASRSTLLLLKEGVRASLTAPLWVDGRTVGLFFRSSRRPHAYAEHEVRLHLAMAERLAQAVEKAWRIEQLEHANLAYTEMLGFVAHELKSPVASLVMDARVLADGYLGDVNPAQRDKLLRMIGKGEHLLGLVRDYLDLARLEGGGLALRPRADVDWVREVVEPAADLVRPQIEARRMRLEITPAAVPPVECDVELARVVMTNLIGNAARYGFPGGGIRVTAARENGSLVVAVRNDGPGFPASERGRLFRRFSRLQTPELLKEKGSGVGLYTCWRIVQLHGGRLRADSEAGAWAEFTFTFPQPLPAREPRESGAPAPPV
jgi:signal transduction histidine kinase